MKRFLAFVLLICHMNSSMFLPQSAECDLYDQNGQQEDDINSVVELIRVELGYDKTADDEDDDTGQNFHMMKVVDIFYQPTASLLSKIEFIPSDTKFFAEYIENKIPLVNFEILTPPPEA